ncbi:MAG: metal-dependent transcriptional regulator [Desulfococcus multivorans]|jgi:DtxR family Mn-dependent transcriptional regulator|nr:metal-dependent transcriptional regulator [Desulfococcus multivorans]
MKSSFALTPSLEDYLEAIYQLERKNRVARVKDIAELMNVQMPSVTGAVKNLKDRKLVNYEKNSYISLSEQGLAIAKSIQGRHSVLRNFLEEILHLEPETAEREACRMEHAISPETAQRFQNCARALKKEVFDTGFIDADRWESILKAPH